MRVLVLTPVYPNPSSSIEGIFNEQHARALLRAGVDVTVVVCKPWLPETVAKKWGRYRFLSGLPDRECRNGIKILYCRYVHIPGFRLVPVTVHFLARSLIQAIEGIHTIKPFDVIHVHSSWPVGLAAPIIRDRLGIPFTVTLHIQDNPRLYQSYVGRLLYRRMFEKASAIIAVGTPMKRFAHRLMPEDLNTPIIIIPNGVDIELIDRVSQNTSTNSWGHIVSISSLVKIKGIDYNIRALALLYQKGLSNWHYTVVGDGPERFNLETLARKLNIIDKVTFIGELNHSTAIRAIAKSDIFCLPSWREAFGIAYLEAMVCGKPVIGCKGQGAEDLVISGYNGLLVRPKDVSSLANALSKLICNPKWAMQLGRAGRKRAERFTWDRTASETLTFYKVINNCVNTEIILNKGN